MELSSVNTCLEQGDIHVLLVDHKEFKCMDRPEGAVIDCRGIWNK